MSEIRKFQRCRRSWYLQYRAGEHGLGYTVKREDETHESSGRSLGTLVHQLIEGGEHGWKDAFAAVLAEEGEPSPERAKDFALAERMVSGYFEWAATEGLDVGIETVGQELKLAYEIRPGVTVTGTLDHLYFDPLLNAHVVRDYKTVQTLTQTPHQVDFQLRTYALLANLCLPDVNVRAGEHVQIRKVKRTGSTAKPPFFGRARIAIDADEEIVHLAHLAHVLRDMTDTLYGTRYSDVRSPVLYPNPTRDCSWDCDFRGVCAMVDDASDHEFALEIGYTPKSPTTNESEGSTLDDE
jgi:hypothetical protein